MACAQRHACDEIKIKVNSACQGMSSGIWVVLIIRHTDRQNTDFRRDKHQVYRISNINFKHSLLPTAKICRFGRHPELKNTIDFRKRQTGRQTAMSRKKTVKYSHILIATTYSKLRIDDHS